MWINGFVKNKTKSYLKKCGVIIFIFTGIELFFHPVSQNYSQHYQQIMFGALHEFVRYHELGLHFR
jgi:hypothetical protein